VQAFAREPEIAALRERGLDEGVLVADYRVAAGLEFRHVLICGATKGVSGRTRHDTLVDDAEWRSLREGHPFIEDAELRVQRAREAAVRALPRAAALTWMAPLFEPGGARSTTRRR
jgi:hypothetical protein